MDSGAGSNSSGYMKGSDYLKAVFAGKYFILSVVLICISLTAVYSYYRVPRSIVSVVIKPGFYIAEGGKAIPVLKPESIANLITEGAFNGLVQQSLNLNPQEPMKFDVVNPRDTDVIKVTYENSKTSDGLRVLKELVSQLSNYYEKERVKLNVVSDRNFDLIKKELSGLELNRIKISGELENLIKEKNRFLATPANTAKDKTIIDEQIKNRQNEINRKRKEIENIDQEIISLKKQIAGLEAVRKNDNSLNIIQAPIVISNNFAENFFKNVIVAAILSFVFAVLLQFMIYDVKKEGGNGEKASK